MGLILDTSVLIAAEREQLALDRLLADQAEETVGVAAISAAELLHGCHRAHDKRVQVQRFAFVEAILDAVPVHAFGLLEARRHAALWAMLAAKGVQIGPHDLQIAATALARGYVLATLNEREFRRIPGLDLLDLTPYAA